ncbi:MAG: metallophosphoesterase [Bacillota bacterium]|uniref:metallophosphoesterase n=1 Tax=unclassified Virgibacillus TaxID=2620237 RepID=UPI000EF50993|nr:MULTISPECIES: metallophosphoesterase [unclassified Virgibacillus]MCC2248474.1 metallophosphoesterase [Virgibacillus sp. AGTR]MDY7043091.1 metallophosphoesterase [Virgibacillus sp. M23]QRZ16662.1 metallophosphoesterase [Virgibacillus sp. AGTR]
MYISIGIIALLSYFIYIGYRNTHSVVVNQIDIEKDIETNKGKILKILHISDLHIENISITPQNIMQQLDSQSLDLIALTGDFLDRKKSIPKLIPYLEELSKLNPKYGAYAVFGNHDYVLKDRDFQQLKDILNQYGFKTLQNENAVITVDGEAVNVIGIDNFSTNHSNLVKSFAGLQQGSNLVLTHDPNVVLEMDKYHFDYLLSGHFHGGQIHWPKPYHLRKMGKLVKLNMVKGLHKLEGRPFYISEGLGQTGINIRVGSRPEITIHHLRIGNRIKEVI